MPTHFFAKLPTLDYNDCSYEGGKVNLDSNPEVEAMDRSPNPYQTPSVWATEKAASWGPRNVAGSMLCGLALLWGVPLLVVASFLLIGLLQLIAIKGPIDPVAQIAVVGVIGLSSIFSLVAAEQYGDDHMTRGHCLLACSVGLALLLLLTMAV